MSENTDRAYAQLEEQHSEVVQAWMETSAHYTDLQEEILGIDRENRRLVYQLRRAFAGLVVTGAILIAASIIANEGMYLLVAFIPAAFAMMVDLQPQVKDQEEWDD
jgi:hypothetical protein